MNGNTFWEKGNCYKNREYYIQLLPKYLWGGVSDIEYLDMKLHEFLKSSTNNTLEFGAGSGRGTKILQKYTRNITAVEINPHMLSSFECKTDKITLINENMNSFINKRPLDGYDLIFSFWGPYPNSRSTNILLNKILPKTKGIFFHAHRGAYEQKLIRQVLQKYNDYAYNPNKDTSIKEDSFRNVIETHHKQGLLEYQVEEVLGKSQFESLDAAIESFLNFHLTGIFEKQVYLKVYAFLKDCLREHTLPSGKVSIESGMKIFSFIRH